MRVGLIVPMHTPPTGGNLISAQRLQAGLTQLGISSTIESLHSSLPPYDIYHAWNAVQTGQALIQQGINPQKILITWTGTDVWGDWVDDSVAIRQHLHAIEHHVVFTPIIQRRLLQDAPEWAPRVQVIPPSVDETLFFPSAGKTSRDNLLIVMAGGIRSVKRNAWAITLVEQARQTLGLNLRLALLGPVRQEDEWRRVLNSTQDRPWVQVVGEVPKTGMADWYRQAGIVLNTSHIEGVSNALMEAMACGSLILATNIPGNRYLIDPQKTGLVFESDRDFVQAVGWVFSHPIEVEQLRHHARQRIVSQHRSQHEAQRYVTLYREALQSKPSWIETPMRSRHLEMKTGTNSRSPL